MGFPAELFGCLDDVDNAYRFSNWGASGLVYAWLHLNPKHAYVLWTLRGKLPVDLQLSSTGWQTTSWEANSETLEPKAAKIILSKMPLYVTGKGTIAIPL